MRGLTTTVTTVRTVREYVATGDATLAALQYQGLAGTFGPAAVADPTARVWVRQHPDGEATTLLAVSGDRMMA
jgi:hypothetical protein